MKRIAMLIGIACVTAAGSASAVCLLGDYSVAAEFQRSAAVVTGKVVNAEEVPPLPPYFDLDGTNYTMTIDAVYRGNPPNPLVLFSENSSGRFPMVVGSSYLVFVYEAAGRYSVDNCGNSGPIDQNASVLETVVRLRDQMR